MIEDRRFLLAMLVVAAIGVAVMPLLLGAEDPILDLHRKQIREMSVSERERLERNFRRFSELSEAERARFREMHAELEADRMARRGRLNAVLEIYEQWLQTLPHYERDALQQEPDPVRRIALIRDVLERQREDRIEIRLGAQQEERLGPIPTLSADDLEKMLAILEQTAESMLPTQAVARQLDGVEGRARTLKLFAIMGRQDQRLITLLTDDLMQRLMEAISDEKARTMLETIPDRPQTAPMARKVKMVLTLWMNLDLAIEREMRHWQITDSMMQQVLNELPAAEQEELLELSPTLFRRELRARASEGDSPRRIDRRSLRRFFRPTLDNRAARGNGADSSDVDG